MKILISETTEKERTKIVDGALALGTIESLVPSKDLKIFWAKYINGEMEAVEVQEAFINHVKELHRQNKIKTLSLG